MRTETKPTNGTLKAIETIVSSGNTPAALRKALEDVAGRKGGQEVIKATQSFMERFLYQNHDAITVMSAISTLSKALTPNPEETKRQDLTPTQLEELARREVLLESIEEKGHKTILDLIETAGLFRDKDTGPVKYLDGMARTAKLLYANAPEDSLLRISLEQVNNKLRLFVENGKKEKALSIASRGLPNASIEFGRANLIVDFVELFDYLIKPQEEVKTPQADYLLRTPQEEVTPS